MEMRVGARALSLAAALLLVGALAAQKLNTSPFELDTPDKPSNGVLLLTAEPVSSSHPKGEAVPLLPNGRIPWEGALNLRLTNISQGSITLNAFAPAYSFYYEVWDDNTRRRAPGTPLGKQIAGSQRGLLMLGFLGAETLHLAPGESYKGFLDLARLFQIKVGERYTIKIRRTRDSRTTDGSGKPLPTEKRDLSCTIHIPGDGVEK